MIDRNTAARIAYEWHGGQASPLYSFASSGGKVLSEDHRSKLIREIHNDMSDAIEQSALGAMRILDDLLAFVCAEPIRA